jgi:hypothetical protein
VTRLRTDPSRNRASPSRDREEAVSFCRLLDPGRPTFLAADTRTAYRLDSAGAEGGKNADYSLRWVDPIGEKGPWAETATATIGA